EQVVERVDLILGGPSQIEPEELVALEVTADLVAIDFGEARHRELIVLVRAVGGYGPGLADGHLGLLVEWGGRNCPPLRRAPRGRLWLHAGRHRRRPREDRAAADAAPEGARR